MVKNIFSLLLVTALCCGFSACEKKKTKAQQTAEMEKVWREQQRQKAIKYYAELAEKFPDSEFAAKAKEKLQQLGPPAPGAKSGAKPTAGGATARK